MKKIKNALVILAGGIGTRFGKKLPKQFIEINGENLIQFFLRRIDTTNFNIIVIVHKKSYSKYINKIKINFPSNQFLFVNAGKNRQQSSFNGLIKLKQYQPENVLIHDAARPFVGKGLITKSLDQLKTNVAVCPGLPLTDTIASVTNNKVSKIIDREKVYRLQTPQSFNFKILSKCHNMIDESVTDDISIILHFGYVPKIIKGSDKNMKITYKSDLKIIKSLI